MRRRPAEPVRALRTALPALLGLGPLPAFVVLLPFMLPWLPSAARPLRALADAERRRAGRLLDREIPAPYRPVGAGVAAGRRPAGSWTTWRGAAWTAAHGLTGLVAAVPAVGLAGDPAAASSPCRPT